MHSNTPAFRTATYKFYFQTASTQMIRFHLLFYSLDYYSSISILISHLTFLFQIIFTNILEHMASQIFPSPFTLFDPTLLKRLESIFWNYNQSKFSYPELSHRSPYYAEVNLKSQQLIASYFSLPNNYHVIYLASEAGYSAIPFNLVKITNNRAVYVVNDKQSQFAYKEAAKINQATLTVNTQQDRLKIASQYGGEAFYTFYNRVSKENGQTNSQLVPLSGQILVCNLNYCAHYQTVNISNHGVVIFDSGHGFGLAGMTVAIVRKDLVGSQLPTCPDLMSFSYSVKAKSIINTPYTLVPLLFVQYISYLDQNKQSHSAVKQHLQKIKEEFTSELKKKTEVLHTSSAGLLKIKIPADFSSDKVQQFGWRVADDQLVMLLQQVNQGKASEFASILFS